MDPQIGQRPLRRASRPPARMGRRARQPANPRRRSVGRPQPGQLRRAARAGGCRRRRRRTCRRRSGPRSRRRSAPGRRSPSARRRRTRASSRAGTGSPGPARSGCRRGRSSEPGRASHQRTRTSRGLISPASATRQHIAGRRLSRPGCAARRPRRSPRRRPSPARRRSPCSSGSRARSPDPRSAGRAPRKAIAPGTCSSTYEKSSAPITGSIEPSTASSPRSSTAVARDERCEVRIVDRDRVEGQQLDLGRRAVGRGDPVRQPDDSLVDHRAGLLREGPDRAFEAGGLGNDVVRGARRDVGDRDDGRVEDLDLAGDERLEADDDLGGNRDRVERLRRLRGMARRGPGCRCSRSPHRPSSGPAAG